MYASAIRSDAPWFYRHNARPLVVGHRGSMGHGLEHALSSLTDAWLHGADWLELDIQMTKDGVLLGAHDECLKESTNAHLFDEMWADRL